MEESQDKVILEKLRLFRENFEATFHREMTPDEARMFDRIQSVLKDRIAKQKDEK